MECAAVFYNRYAKRVSGITTIGERNEILADMQEDFSRQVRNEPGNRNQLSEVYQQLKRECWEVLA